MANTKKMLQALAGIRVLDVGTMVSAPFAATLLAEFGAEVIKIELPKEGSAVRHIGTKYNGVSLWWKVRERNKKSMTLDLRKRKGQDVFKKLVAISDVVCENFLPGTLEKWNLGYEELRAINPRLVLLRVSGFGQDGPYKNKASYDRVAQSMGGLVYLTGYPDKPPVRAGLGVADYGTGVYGALGVLLSLYYRDALKGDQGQVVDCAIYETVLRPLECYLTDYHKLGIVPERMGNANPSVSPGDLFKTKDEKWASISIGNDRLFKSLAKAIGREELSCDPRFETAGARAKHSDEINSILHEWVAKHVLREVSDIFSIYEIPIGPVYSVKDIAEDEHYRQRGSVLEFDDPTISRTKVVGVAPKLSLTPGKVEFLGQDAGKHTREILSGLLGYSDKEIDDLQAEEVI